MMRSMFSGVSGLRAHQQRMDVIGNNVANVNTVGFKSSRVTFQEVFNQTLSGATAPDSQSSRGGTNPVQIGLGTSVGSVDTLMTGGSPERTDNPTDLSIGGDGFFIVKGSSSDTYKFTRAGNFGLDKLGNLVTGNGYCVYGWSEYQKDENGKIGFNTEEEVEPINLYSNSTTNKKVIPAEATTKAALAGNLNSEQLPANSVMVPVTVYDKLGNSYTLSVNFTKGAQTADSTPWSYTIPNVTVKDADGNQKDLAEVTSDGETSITFDSKGVLSADTQPTQVWTITPKDKGTTEFKVEIDFSKITMYAADNSVKASNVNGYSSGDLTTFSIGSDGIITGIYSNGQQQSLGRIALASFANPAGLEKAGENIFIATTNSGEFNGKGIEVGYEGTGKLNPGTLEMSNVDLSNEFTNMIVTERGFQANSRIITTSDEMLQELVNLKR